MVCNLLIYRVRSHFGFHYDEKIVYGSTNSALGGDRVMTSRDRLLCSVYVIKNNLRSFEFVFSFRETVALRTMHLFLWHEYEQKYFVRC